jgi:hypothetical protein
MPPLLLLLLLLQICWAWQSPVALEVGCHHGLMKRQGRVCDEMCTGKQVQGHLQQQQ